MSGKGSLMSPFIFFNSVSRRPIWRWLLIAIVLAGLLMITSRAWSAPVPTGSHPTVAAQSTHKSTHQRAIVHTSHASTAQQKPLLKAAATSPKAATGKAAVTSAMPAALGGHVLAHEKVAATKPGVVPVSNERASVSTVAAVGAKAPTQSFTLTALPDNFTIAQGAGGSSSITVSSESAIPAGTKVAVSGLPAGVTAFVTPIDAAGRSTVIVNASKTAPTGPAKMTVAAGDGGSVTVMVNVIHDNDPDFSPTVLPGRISVSQGSDNSCDVALTPINGFAAPVSLTLSGVPSGVTATFEPASTSTSSTLHISASTRAMAAGTPITILATSGGITHTARVLLRVEARPDFGLSAWTNRVSMTAGAMGADTVTIDSLNGFNAPVALEVTDLPAGVTGHFSPALAKTGTSTLLLTSAPGVAAGSATITVTATSGKLVHQRTISVDIAAGDQPGFAVTAWPADLTVYAGGSAANTVRIVRGNGFSDLVNLSIAGLPDGVTAAFTPSSTRGSSTLTLDARPGLSIDTPITAIITGVSGGVSHTVSLNLRIGDRQASTSTQPAGKAF